MLLMTCFYNTLFTTRFYNTCTENWNKMKSHHLTKQGIIGAIFNTDGVSPFKSSRITIWPIFISVINLAPSVRMLKHNVVTCLLWVGKPQMPLIFEHFKQMVNTHGIQGPETFVPVFDLVAILNMNQFNGINGKSGCPSCIHPGRRIGHTQTYTDYATVSMKVAGKLNSTS